MRMEDLLAACAQGGDADAWQEFVRRFHGLIGRAVLRTVRRYSTPQPSLVEDLIQETYMKLCANRYGVLKNFQPQHPDSVFGLIKVVATNVVHDHFKTARATKRGSEYRFDPLESQPAAVPAAHAAGYAEIERRILLQEIDGILQRSLPGSTRDRDRNIFWLYYRHGLTAQAISRIRCLDLTTKGVESTILRLARMVREGMCQKPLTKDASRRDKSATDSF
jgi:RNA polymerase sigma-70 factor (ECF subfamily)